MKSLDRQKYWEDRILYNGWDKLGAAGAAPYLKKYGNNISDEKIESLVNLCKSEGAYDLADGFDEVIHPKKSTKSGNDNRKDEIFKKTWTSAYGSGGYSTDQKSLHRLIKKKIYPIDKKDGKPLLPSHKVGKTIKATDFDFDDENDVWEHTVAGIKYSIIKNL